MKETVRAHPQKAIIIGAGPGGLTAAYELLHRTDVLPVILEGSGEVGGLSKTVVHNGNRLDIGGHRFFSKSRRVLDWWLTMLPLEDGRAPGVAPGAEGVFLVRNRLSRILAFGKLFDYPVRLSFQTAANLGPLRLCRVLWSYCAARLAPIRNERNLEDFFINRFGRALYVMFFKSYTEKVWGVSCREISPEWGAQRIKGLSLSKAVAHAVRQFFAPDAGLRQRNVETSLIERFMYPQLGPGQMWETVQRKIAVKGVEVCFEHEVTGLVCQGRRVTGVTVMDKTTGRTETIAADYVLSTMPIKDLVAAMTGDVPPPEALRVADGLQYRDFMTMGLLVRSLTVGGASRLAGDGRTVRDNWIYIHEPGVKIARLQIFNNWSPHLVKDADTVWLGLEYMCREGDSLWRMSDGEFKDFAVGELAGLGLILKGDVLDYKLLRVPKAYPAYTGSYQEFAGLRAYLDQFENLFLIGRNGMHKYNNQDHSMLTAMTAVDNIAAGRMSKDNIWSVNTEQQFHEEKDDGAGKF